MTQHVSHRHSDEIAQLNEEIARLREKIEILEAELRVTKKIALADHPEMPHTDGHE